VCVCVCARTHRIYKNGAHILSIQTNGAHSFFSEQYAPAQSAVWRRTKKSARTRPRVNLYILSEPGACKFELCARWKLFKKFRPCFFDAHSRASERAPPVSMKKNYDDGNIMSHSSSGKDGDYFFIITASGINEGPHRSFWIDRALR
jgi:hypothetical protein